VISPYGGALVDLVARGEERFRLLEEARRCPSIRLSPRALHDLELLAVGGFSPLRGFLGEADYRSVLQRMRLADGTLWPIPVTLEAGEDAKGLVGHAVVLRGPGTEPLALLAVDEVYRADAQQEAEAVLGRADPAHPLVSEMATAGPFRLGGRLRVIDRPRFLDFADLRLTPLETRRRLEAMGAASVLAFQTRNPLHRSHEEMIRRGLLASGGVLLLHPTVGPTRSGDVDAATRVRTYRAAVAAAFDPRHTLLGLLPLAMRLAGPREAVWHAILRRNYGATHFMVGRDHAGPGLDSTGRPFFPPGAAQSLALEHAAEVGITIVACDELVYLPDEDRYEEAGRVAPGRATLALSGTEVREHLAQGRPLPRWFTRPEVASVLAEAYPPRHRQGFCVWLTGLPAAGKSCTAEAVEALLRERGRRVTLLDGDAVREHLSRGLGFSREDRDANVRRIGFVAAEVARHGGAVVCAAVSPYRAARDECRRDVGKDRFFEVFVDTPLAVCEARDPKGLYARARSGQAHGVTGIDDPYEPPLRPELVLGTVETTPLENAGKVIALLRSRGFLGDER
jgi:sulfate adenylyltransferase